MYGSALSNAFLAEKYYRHVAALRITAVARGRLARRRVKAIRELEVIKGASHLLLRHALKSVVDRPRVFWYKRQAEIDLLFHDYVLLVEKTGYNPTRQSVENNIAELAYRILARKHQLIVMLQRRWRGFMTRRIVQFYKTEIVRQWQQYFSRVLKIQRLYRGHSVRLKLPRKRNDQRREKIMQAYLARGRDHLVDKAAHKTSEKIMVAYRQQREEEKTARLSQMIPPPREYDNKKMHSYWDSVYADEKLDKEIDIILTAQKSTINKKEMEIKKENDRKEFIKARIAENGPDYYGLRSVSKHILEQGKNPRPYVPVVNISEEALIVATKIPKFTASQSGDSHDAISIASSTVGFSSLANGSVDNRSERDPSEIERSTKAHKRFHEIAAAAAEAVRPDDAIELKPSARGEKMRLYFIDELEQLTQKIIERKMHDFSKGDLLSQFLAHNGDRKPTEKAVGKINDAHRGLTRLNTSNTALTMGTVHEVQSNDLGDDQNNQVMHAKLSRQVSGLTDDGEYSTTNQSIVEPHNKSTRELVKATSNISETEAIIQARLQRIQSHGAASMNRSYSVAKKGKANSKPKGNNIRKDYKYPENINFKATDWLFGNDSDDC